MVPQKQVVPPNWQASSRLIVNLLKTNKTPKHLCLPSFHQHSRSRECWARGLWDLTARWGCTRNLNAQSPQGGTISPPAMPQIYAPHTQCEDAHKFRDPHMMHFNACMSLLNLLECDGQWWEQGRSDCAKLQHCSVRSNKSITRTNNNSQ